MDARELAERCIEICDGRKAEGLRLYDMQGTSLLADYYLICSGKSVPHLRAICDHLSRDLAQEGVRPHRVDGTPASQWIVMDYGVVLVHIFHPELREFYDIEALWGEAHIVSSVEQTD